MDTDHCTVQQILKFQCFHQVSIPDEALVHYFYVVEGVPDCRHFIHSFFQDFPGTEYRSIVLHSALHVSTYAGGRNRAFVVANPVLAAMLATGSQLNVELLQSVLHSSSALRCIPTHA